MASRVTDSPDPRWEAFAAREPYFSILTADRYRRANLDEARVREFFESGEQLVQWMLRVIEERLQPEFAPMTVLEYGCGVGRLAIPLAARAGSVVAVDRSPAMLAQARREAAERQVEHIRFLAPTQLFANPRPFDLITCHLVLQRMPTRDGLDLLRDLLGLLGPGGIAIVQVPYRETRGWLARAGRIARAGVPGVNAVANAIKGKALSDPFGAVHTYSLDDVTRVIDDASASGVEMQVVLERQEGLSAATIFVKAPDPSARRVGARRVQAGPDAPIDVRQLMADASIDELNRAAEEYFSSLTEWDHHLAKPLTTPEEAPALLTDVALLIQGLQLTAGMTVLEFGAGTGWLSRFLTQLGCRSVLLDVSPTALRMAASLYERLPIIGTRPAPTFLPFDGRRIDLPDASVDRIIVFHAFHHAPNPDEVLREFARVLRPGGIAGFAEPGPRHSETPLSQFEMRTYRVVENDVDVHAIWRSASRCGFSDMTLAVFHAPPFHVSIAEYEDLLAGGQTGGRWLASTRGFLRHVRTFFLHAGTQDAADSRLAAGLRAKIETPQAATGAAGQAVAIAATVTNAGASVWLPSDAGRGAVFLGAHIHAQGKLLTFDACRAAPASPSRPIARGESVDVRLLLPPLPAGEYLVELDCVAEGVTWFAQVGSSRATVRLTVA